MQYFIAYENSVNFAKAAGCDIRRTSHFSSKKYKKNIIFTLKNRVEPLLLHQNAKLKILYSSTGKDDSGSMNR